MVPVTGAGEEIEVLLTVWHAEGLVPVSTAASAAEPVHDVVSTALRLRSQFEDLRRSDLVDALRTCREFGRAWPTRGSDHLPTRSEDGRYRPSDQTQRPARS